MVTRKTPGHRRVASGDGELHEPVVRYLVGEVGAIRIEPAERSFNLCLPYGRGTDMDDRLGRRDSRPRR
jgi:hypothetical protein